MRQAEQQQQRHLFSQLQWLLLSLQQPLHCRFLSALPYRRTFMRLHLHQQ